jgi:hypothetical protein
MVLHQSSAPKHPAMTVQALVWRQLLIKTRAWGTTLAELCSPVLLICMLVVAYHLVHPDHHDARVSKECNVVIQVDDAVSRRCGNAMQDHVRIAAGVCW